MLNTAREHHQGVLFKSRRKKGGKKKKGAGDGGEEQDGGVKKKLKNRKKKKMVEIDEKKNDNVDGNNNNNESETGGKKKKKIKKLKKKVEIVDAGDTRFLEEDLEDRYDFNEENDRIFDKKVVVDQGESGKFKAGQTVLFGSSTISRQSFSRQIIWPTPHSLQVIWPTNRLADRVVWPTRLFGRQGRLADSHGLFHF